MLATVGHPRSCSQAIRYNERKVGTGAASFIHAGNYLQEAGELTAGDKKERFDKLNELNPGVSRKTLHVSLNFDPGEHIGEERLTMIADEYMERIGFGDQPYLVYQHTDSGHPHIHIVATSIRSDGSAINMHNLLQLQSEPARKAIEEKYELVRGQGPRERYGGTDNGANGRRLVYGASETGEGIRNVLTHVLGNYTFTNLQEFQGLLREFNVLADGGRPGTATYEHRGFVYQALDEAGRPVGARIPASRMGLACGIDALEAKFSAHRLAPQPDTLKIRNAIDQTILNGPEDWKEWVEEMTDKGVRVVPHKNRQGLLHDLTFVDHQNRIAVSGAGLGSSYTTAAILERTGISSDLNVQRQKPELEQSRSHHIKR